jgi:hypothetical protein
MTVHTRSLVKWITAASVTAAIAIILLWVVAALPIICPAIYPAPASCAADARLMPALWGSVAVVSVFLATVIVGVRVEPTNRAPAMSVMVIVLAVLSIIALLVTLSASGFAIGF